MNRTFGFLMMCLLAVGLLASCNKKENNNGTADGKGFKAITEQNGGGNSKTHGVLHEAGTDHEYLEVQWTQYDQIKVNNGSETSTFETSDENTTTGDFYLAGGMPFDFTSGDFTAIYPATNADGVENTVGNLSATFNLPATQAYSAEHPSSFAEKAMPMMAHSDNQTLYFKNVLGGVCFPMVGDGLHVSKIVLTSSNTADKLWGVFNANYNNGEPTLTHASEGSNSITLTCDVTLYNTNATEFTIMVPPGTLANGFTVAAYDGEIKIYEKSTSSAPGANFIPRNVIRVVDQDLNVVISGLTVTTASPVFITTDSAYCAGTVTVSSKDIEPITERGICWALASVTTTPTLDNDYTAEGQTTAGTYGITIEGLTKDQVYYVRAYAKNTLGEVTYGTPIPFATRRDYVANGGKLDGQFSVASGQKHYFAMGNLQYKVSNNTWRYANYQFEYVGYSSVGNVYANGEHPNPADNGLKSGNECIEYYSDPSQITAQNMVNISNNACNTSYQGWIDWFAWGTSGRNHHTSTAPLYQPWCKIKYYTATPQYTWQISPYFHNYYPGNDNLYMAFDTDGEPLHGNADWACNTIQNGSAAGKYTPSANDFEHILHVRNASTVNGVANARYSLARLQVRRGQMVNGIFLFPDNFTWPTTVGHYPSHINITPAQGAETWTNVAVFTEAEWSLLEKANVVFLPACGCYGRTGYCEWGSDSGRYWTSTAILSVDGGGAYDFAFSPLHTVEGVVNAYAQDHRFYGFSVRFMMP